MQDKPTFHPLYGQVRSAILKRIAAGEWPPGTFLPSESVLAKEYGVSQGTLRKALNELTAEGVVVRYQGKGTAVSTFDADEHLYRFFQLVGANGKHEYPASRVLVARKENASSHVAKALRLERHMVVYHIERIRIFGDKAAINEKMLLPCKSFPGIEAYGVHALPNTLYDFFQKKFQVTIREVHEELTAATADQTDSGRLDVPVGYPLLVIRRVAMDLHGNPVELRFSRCVTADHVYRVQLR